MALGSIGGGVRTNAGRALAALIGAAGLAAWAHAQPLPTRDDIVMGELPNGMRYIVKEHAVPPGRAAMWMHVSSGSLNESDAQRGLAHFLEHMAFNGSKNFPPNSVVDFFQSMGLTFGQHQNAFTSFEQTTYILEMPDNKPETMSKAFAFFSDVAFNLSLLPEEIDEERGIILEERRTGLGADQRVQDYILERIAPGSLLGVRLPIGVEETLTTMQRPDFADYYSRWYVPSNMTLMVVADMDSAAVVAEIEKAFSAGEKVPQPVDQGVGVKPYEKSGAIVATDEELRDADVAIVRIEPPHAPVTTEELLRERLVDQLAVTAFNRRIERKINDGSMSFLQGYGFSSDLFNALRLAQAAAQGEPGKWRDMLRDLATELQRARLHGFSDREVEDARAQMMSQAERAVEVEPTLPARAFLGSFNGAIAQGEPIMSSAQELELYREHVPTITREEISRRFARLFDPSAVMFIAELPTGGDVPTEDELLRYGLECLAVTPEPEAEEARAAALMERTPEPAGLALDAPHEASGVWSGWLDNGVRVHQRFMDYRKDQVTVTITLAGGQIQESAANRGITDAAMLAWGRPATSTLSSTQIRDLMTGKKVNVGGAAGQADTCAMTVSGSPADLETGLQLAHLLLTDPVIEPAAFDQWKVQTLQEIEQRKVAPMGTIQELIPQTIMPGEARMAPIEAHNVEALTLADSQAWLDNLVTTAPIEVSIVGDMDREAAFDLVRRYLGTLPARERISGATLDSLRSIDRPAGPLLAVKRIKTQTPMAIVLGGFFGTDQENVRDRRLLSMASQIMSTRMIKRIREQEQLVYSIGAQSIPATAFPGFGLVFAAAPTEPGKAEVLGQVINEMFGEFAKTGPSEEEMETARKQVANRLDEQMKEPGFWTSSLSALNYRSDSLDAVLEAPAMYEGFTAADVQEAFRRYYAPENTMTVIVAPEESAAAPAEGAGE